jgi:hypothetical protein
LFATRPAATSASLGRLIRYLEVLGRAGFKPVDALSIVQLVAQLVVGHAMWSVAGEADLLGDEVPLPLRPIGRALENWDPDRELEMGIDALIHGFERLLAK